MRRIALLMLSCAAAAGEPQPAWVAANFVGDPPAALMRSREGMLRWVGLWGTRRLQHASYVYAVTVSSDGKWIASGSSDGIARIWDTNTGREVRTFSGNGEIMSVALGPDDRRLYTGELGGRICVWDAAGGVMLRSTHLDPDLEFWRFRLSPDGKHLVCLGRGGFRICNATTLEVVNVDWVLPTATLGDARFTADSRRLLTCGDNLVSLSEVSSGATKSFAGPGGTAPQFDCVAMDSRGEEVAASWESGEIFRWNPKTGERRPPLEGHDGQVLAMAYSPDGETIASACSDEIRLWHRATGACSRTWSADAEIEDLAFAPDGSWLVTGDENGCMRIWDPQSGGERLAGNRPPCGIDNISVSADGTLAVSSLWTEAWAWDTATGACRQRVARAGLHTMASVTLPDGRVLSDWGSDAGGWWQGGVTLWDPQSGRELASLDGVTEFRAKIAVDPKGRWAVGTSDSDVYVWDLGSGALARTLQGGPSHVAVAISPDGTRIAAASKNLVTQATGLLLWGPNGGAPISRIDGPPQTNAICFSPDGARIAGGCADGTVHLWAANDLAEVAVLRGHDGEVTSITWSSDGRSILSCGKDATVRAWDAATGKEADRIVVDGGPQALALRKDRLYVGCGNRTVCVYTWTPPR